MLTHLAADLFCPSPIFLHSNFSLLKMMPKTYFFFFVILLATASSTNESDEDYGDEIDNEDTEFSFARRLNEFNPLVLR
jgi:hypothetical protein